MNVVDEVSLATERNAVWNQVKYENGWYIINGERIITGKRVPVVDAEEGIVRLSDLSTRFITLWTQHETYLRDKGLDPIPHSLNCRGKAAHVVL
jgi:hypothetical protein